MTDSLETFIHHVITAPTIEEERITVSNEQANLRTFARNCYDHYKPRVVAKLIFLTLRGENTSWGQMEVVNLMNHERFSYKRIGYIGASLMLDELNERIVLITATVQKDLNSKNIMVQNLALALIANIASPEMCQSTAPSVITLLGSQVPSVQKAAALAGVRILRKCPELCEQFRPPITRLLNHGQHSVVMAGISLALEMLKIDPKLAQPWSGFTTPFTKILKVLFETHSSYEFNFTIFNDPFLQIKIMQIISVVKSPSDELDDLLSSIVTGVDVRRNTGRSLLLQAVQTIGLTAKKPSLRSLAYNQVSRLFSYNEPNILYSALSAFSRILYSENQILDRSSSDSIVLQRHKSQVVHCLDHRDPSIRRRALDVVAALIDETNVETLIPEVMSYIKMADGDFRTEMVAKVFSSVQRFAPTVIWNFDTVLKLLSESGNYVGNDVITSFCKLIARNIDLRQHAITSLQNSLYSDSNNQTLLQVSSWALGEFLEEQSAETIDTLIKLCKMPQTKVDTKCYIITALSKLATRFGKYDTVSEILNQLEHNNDIEIQQRSGEMLRIIQKGEIKEQLLAPIEPEEIDVNNEGNNTQQQQKQSSNNLDDLLNLSETPANNNNENTKSHDDSLLEIIEDALTTPQSNQKAVQEIRAPQGAKEVLRTADYVIFFEIQRNVNNPNQIAIRSSIFGLGKMTLNNFIVQYGVPQGWAVMAQQPSGNVLGPNGSVPIRQVLMLENRGAAQLMMKTQISYMYGTQPIKEMGTIQPSVFN
ncbi:Adaptin N terminal region family protein [Histomonas meleagridis]|uniref:Adaptin N terminal region family protein n=1 Tax=Histomonas meleagridis TaxID=135588 RepID=UPI003559F57E|nr:Adaptin N terminal region family protein [Histomonas meleagridis]KAH0801328.1 Adaptin N terminal region family protein [Histomonas meleagridis]